MLLPFDAHNHIHMGPTEASHAVSSSSGEVFISGMAIMSTHPRDFSSVLDLAKETLPRRFPSVGVIPCLGIHPWFLHDLKDEDWEVTDGSPRWLSDLEEVLLAHPRAIVGEIGLDGFHFDPQTRELTCPLERQLEAFKAQMLLANKLERPVSIHCVRSFGPLFEVLSSLKRSKQLPPRMYFHAFGGKAGTVDQLLALCGRDYGLVYFGFAPVVNFRSPKTAELMRRIGIDRLLLETDHEDAALVHQSLKDSLSYLADALCLTEDMVIKATTTNAFRFYGIEGRETQR